MKLYIDEANVEAFIKAKNSNPDDFAEAIRIVKRGLDVHHNFSKEELKKNQYVSAWLNSIKGQGVQKTSVFCPPAEVTPPTEVVVWDGMEEYELQEEEKPDYHETRDIKSNFYIDYDLEGLSSIYLLNIEDGLAQNIMEKSSVLVGKCGEEIGMFNKFSSLDDMNTNAVDIDSWDNYCPSLPLTDLIICDNYYFKDKTVYDTDNHEFLRAMAKHVGSQINLVLITKDGEIAKNQDKTAEIIDLEKEVDTLTDLLASVTGLSKRKCNVTIMTSHREHNRHAITNYYRVDCTPGFQLHGGKRIAENDTADIKPHVKMSAYAVSLNLIKEYQTVASNPVRIFGSKKSNFLTFA